MTQKFVRYSPDVEQEEPDFDKTLQTVLDDMKQHMRGSLKTEGIGLVVRNAHAELICLEMARGFAAIEGPTERNECSRTDCSKHRRNQSFKRFPILTLAQVSVEIKVAGSVLCHTDFTVIAREQSYCWIGSTRGRDRTIEGNKNERNMTDI